MLSTAINDASAGSESTISAAALADQFRQFIDADYVITDTETQRVYECDGLATYCELPLLTVLPETVPQVQKILQLCHQYGVAVVARGAGTGLSAGATPNKYGVLLSLAKLNQIIDIDYKTSKTIAT